MSDIRKPSFWSNLVNKIIKIILNNLGMKTSVSTHNQHVVPHEDGWAVRGEGNERLSGKFKNQDDAIKRAKEIAINYESALIIHRRDGTIRDRVNYTKQ